MWFISVAALVGCSADVPGGGGGNANDDAGAGADGPGPNGQGGDGAGSPLEEDPFEPAPALPPLSASAVAALEGELGALFDAVPAAAQSVLVIGADTGQVIYARNPDQPLKPASTTKLLTTALAFTELGEDHRMTTRLLGTSAPSGGVLDGDLVLHSEHEIDWTTWLYDDARFAIDALVAELAESVTHINGKVEVRGEVLFEPDNFGYYDPDEHREAVADQLEDALDDAGISHGWVMTNPTFAEPTGAVELASWSSSALPVSASPINRISHNEQADTLVRHLGYRLFGTSSTELGNDGMRDLLSQWTDAGGVELYDGSGLSHSNRLSARQLVAVFEGMRHEPSGLAWERTMSIGGVRGSFSKVFNSADTLGRVRAKNGRLTAVITMAGFLDHQHDGQRYLFAMLANGLDDEQAAVNANIWAVEALADDHRVLGARPDAPVLRSVMAGADPKAITVQWDAVAGSEGYLVWRSEDGKTWLRDEARYVHATEHTTMSFASGATLYVRVTAVGTAGESDASDVYAATPGDGARVLIVDGNDRWQLEPQPENPSALGHDFAALHAAALDGRAVDTCDNDAVLLGSCPLDGYAGVIWSLGEESTTHESFSDSEQSLVASYLVSGGRLLVSGAELAWDLGPQGSATDTAFLEDVLGVAYVGDDALTWWAVGDLGRLTFYTPDRMVIGYADQLASMSGAAPLLDYVGGDGGSAAVVGERTVVLGFPFESVDNQPQRIELMTTLLSALGV